MYAFEYQRPAIASDASKLLAGGSVCQAAAGGHTLIPP